MEQKTKQKVQSIQFYVDTINSAMFEYLSLAVNKSQLAGTVIRLFGFIGTSSTALSEQPVYPTGFSLESVYTIINYLKIRPNNHSLERFIKATSGIQI